MLTIVQPLVFLPQNIVVIFPKTCWQLLYEL